MFPKQVNDALDTVILLSCVILITIATINVFILFPKELVSDKGIFWLLVLFFGEWRFDKAYRDIMERNK